MRIALPPVIAVDAATDLDRFAVVETLDGLTMGTTWRVQLRRPAGVALDAVRATIVARLDRLVAELSHWAPGSTLSQFNRAPGGSWTRLPADFAHVMTLGLRIAAETDGAFDPAIGHLVDLWGFGPPGPMPAPAEHELAATRAASGWRRLALDTDRLRQPGGLALDLSGIAKGHAVDVVADLLGTLGIRHCLVEIGGELVGRGIRPDGEPWWVDLETPPGIAIAPLRLALHGPGKGLAVATSGAYRRGEHTLDPRTGRPARNGVLSVSTVMASAIEADAWATALTVMEHADGLACATRHAIAARILVDDHGATREYCSPALAAMLAD